MTPAARGVAYALDRASGMWVAPGRESLPAFRAAPDEPTGPAAPPPGSRAYREALVWGTFDPRDPVNTGPLLQVPDPDNVGQWKPRGTHYTQLEAGPDGYVVIDGDNTYLDGYEIWGSIKPFANNIKFGDVKIHGADPLIPTAGSQWGCFKCYDTSARHFEIFDYLIDPMAWVTERGRPHVFGAMYGFHGFDYTAKRGEIRNVTDGSNWLVGGGKDPYAMHMEEFRTWTHRGVYRNALVDPKTGQLVSGDARAHCDSKQINHGKNGLVHECYTGGHRDMTGYQAWGLADQPTTDPTKGRNTGDDFWNTGLVQIGNEGRKYSDTGVDLDPTARLLIENWKFLHNIVEGGTFGVNLARKSTYPNNYPTLEIAYNEFVPREPGWRRSANRDGGLDSGDGGYIIAPDEYLHVFHDNVFRGTTNPVPITRG